MLHESAEVFDIVIVDTPPTALSADSQIIASRAGFGVMVTRANATDANRLRRALASLRDCGANLVGSVLNDG